MRKSWRCQPVRITSNSVPSYASEANIPTSYDCLGKLAAGIECPAIIEKLAKRARVQSESAWDNLSQSRRIPLEAEQAVSNIGLATCHAIEAAFLRI